MAIAGYNPEAIAFGLECLLIRRSCTTRVYEYTISDATRIANIRAMIPAKGYQLQQNLSRI
jgi:hypothetical protein